MNKNNRKLIYLAQAGPYSIDISTDGEKFYGSVFGPRKAAASVSRRLQDQIDYCRANTPKCRRSQIDVRIDLTASFFQPDIEQ